MLCCIRLCDQSRFGEVGFVARCGRPMHRIAWDNERTGREVLLYVCTYVCKDTARYSEVTCKVKTGERERESYHSGYHFVTRIFPGQRVKLLFFLLSINYRLLYSIA